MEESLQVAETELIFLVLVFKRHEGTKGCRGQKTSGSDNRMFPATESRSTGSSGGGDTVPVTCRDLRTRSLRMEDSSSTARTRATHSS